MTCSCRGKDQNGRNEHKLRNWPKYPLLKEFHPCKSINWKSLRARKNKVLGTYTPSMTSKIISTERQYFQGIFILVFNFKRTSLLHFPKWSKLNLNMRLASNWIMLWLVHSNPDHDILRSRRFKHNQMKTQPS